MPKKIGLWRWYRRKRTRPPQVRPRIEEEPLIYSVGRTLLSAAVEFAFDFDLVFDSKSNPTKQRPRASAPHEKRFLRRLNQNQPQQRRTGVSAPHGLTRSSGECLLQQSPGVRNQVAHFERLHQIGKVVVVHKRPYFGLNRARKSKHQVLFPTLTGSRQSSGRLRVHSSHSAFSRR